MFDLWPTFSDLFISSWGRHVVEQCKMSENGGIWPNSLIFDLHILTYIFLVEVDTWLSSAKSQEMAEEEEEERHRRTASVISHKSDSSKDATSRVGSSPSLSSMLLSPALLSFLPSTSLLLSSPWSSSPSSLFLPLPHWKTASIISNKPNSS